MEVGGHGAEETEQELEGDDYSLLNLNTPMSSRITNHGSFRCVLVDAIGG